jgi:hypothetical protein
MNWHINGLGFSTAQSENHHMATGRICYLLCRSSRTRNMEMIISIPNYTKQQQIKYASRTDTIPVLMKRQVPCFYQKGFGLCLLYVSNSDSI